MRSRDRLILVEVLKDGTRIEHYLKPNGSVTIRMKLSKKGGQQLAALFMGNSSVEPVKGLSDSVP